MNSEQQLAGILNKLRNYCSRSEKCCQDVLNYISDYELSSDIKIKIVKTLTDEKFIDHERYVAAFVNDKLKFNKWGKIKIYYNLKQKNIEEKLIKQGLQLIADSDYNEILLSILKNKLKTLKDKDKTKIKAGLLRYSYSRGFEYEISDKLIDSILVK
ncbi:MAG TPA: regulatory protein RecX [Bacteroidales bacterium]|nr:regulatory protein RecX [Bacteroidales bacterium]